MNKRIKELWIAALRSGSYKQGQKRLRWDEEDGPTFCCLGVLCEIAVDESICYRFEDGYKVDAGEPGEHYTLSTSYLPEAVQEWAGLDNSDPDLALDEKYSDGSSRLTTLASLNDGGRTFDEIADLIEENL